MKRHCVATQCLLISMLAIAPAIGQAGIETEAAALERAGAGMARSISEAARGTSLGIGPSGAWLLGSFLPKGKSVGIAQAVKKGSRYAFCGATSGDGSVLGIQVRGADKKLISESRGTAPYVQFSPEADGDVAIWIRLVEAPAPAPAMLALLSDSGVPVKTDAIQPLFNSLGARVRSVGGSKGTLLHPKQDWSIIGSIMSSSRNTILSGLHYGGGAIRAVAVAQPGARNLDMAILDGDRKPVKADNGPDATPQVAAETDAETGYALKLDLVAGPPQTLVLAAVLRDGGSGAATAGAGSDTKPPAQSGATGADLRVATVVPDHLFGLADGATLAYGIWHIRRVKDSVCLTPPDAKFTLEVWEGSNGYLTMRENGETYVWHAVGARVSGKFDITPDEVAEARPTARLAEKNGACRKWLYRFTDQGIELENTDIKVLYTILKDRAEMIHLKNGERIVLPAKLP